MKISIAMTVNNRPEYLRQALATWEQALEGHEIHQFIIALEPGNQECRRLVEEEYRHPAKQVWHNQAKLGVLKNPLQAMNRAIDQGADFVILAEDDVTVSHDVMDLFEYCAEEFDDDLDIIAVNAFSHQAHDRARNHHRVVRRNIFNPLCWGTWADRWNNTLRHDWDTDYSHKGWDWHLHEDIMPPHLRVAAPLLSRSQHIGERGGTHCSVNQFPSTQAPETQGLGQAVHGGRFSYDRDTYFSLLTPTRHRPENMRRLIDSIERTADDVGRIEVVFYIDEDDTESATLAEKLKFSGTRLTVNYTIGPRIVLSECWNKAYEAAHGDILMHCGDDIVFQTKSWDTLVEQEFAACPDKILLVHGRDGIQDEGLATHSFIHQRWVETLGYFVPPLFSSDFNDTWLTELADLTGRRVYLDSIYTEHMHPGVGKAEWDLTHRERIARHERDRPQDLYAKHAPTRKAHAEKLRAACDSPS